MQNQNNSPSKIALRLPLDCMKKVIITPSFQSLSIISMLLVQHLILSLKQPLGLVGLTKEVLIEICFAYNHKKHIKCLTLFHSAIGILLFNKVVNTLCFTSAFCLSNSVTTGAPNELNTKTFLHLTLRDNNNNIKIITKNHLCV